MGGPSCWGVVGVVASIMQHGDDELLRRSRCDHKQMCWRCGIAFCREPPVYRPAREIHIRWNRHDANRPVFCRTVFKQFFFAAFSRDTTCAHFTLPLFRAAVTAVMEAFSTTLYPYSCLALIVLQTIWIYGSWSGTRLAVIPEGSWSVLVPPLNDKLSVSLCLRFRAPLPPYLVLSKQEGGKIEP
jgi:hypothetical protein